MNMISKQDVNPRELFPPTVQPVMSNNTETHQAAEAGATFLQRLT